MKEKTKDVLRGIVNVVVIVLLAFLVFFEFQEREGDYNYCVEWKGFIAGRIDTIYREEMVWRCYDFFAGDIMCDWDVVNNTLYVFEYGNRSNLYADLECTRMVKSRYET